MELRLLYSRWDIEIMVQGIADRLEQRYSREESIHTICVMDGAVMFHSDLVRRLTSLDVITDYIKVSSYVGATSINPRIDIPTFSNTSEKKHIIVVEDICDTGHTLAMLLPVIQNVCQPLSLTTVCLLNKKERRDVPVEPDIYGTICPDQFVIGYGFDHNGRYRNLPDIYTMHASRASV